MTYAKALRAASRPLCGRSGARLILEYRRRQRPKDRGLCAALLLGPPQLSDLNIIRHVNALDPAIALVVRDYARAHTQVAAAIEIAARMQRRTVFTVGTATPGQGEHCPRWRRPKAKARRRGLLSMSVHTAAEAICARRAKADVVFVSPVFKTQSHPGQASLGPFQARRLAQMAGTRTFALGGVNADTVIHVTRPFDGFAAIAGLLKDD